MNIGIYDCDYKTQGVKFPNLALMKISAYHKKQFDSVDWVNGTVDKYDRIYMSRVFTFTKDYSEDFIFSNYRGELIKGGTGYDIKAKLPPEIENIFPDYSIYPHCNYAIGFLSRGCPNNCKFCCVPEKEGKICFNQTWQEIKRPDNSNIVFMDNNVLACDKALNNLESMIGQNINFDFNQGLDAFLFNEQHAELLARLNIKVMGGRTQKWAKGIRFSCDKKSQLPHIENAVKLMNKYGYKANDFKVYAILIDYEDSIYRLNYLRDLGVCVNAQPYRDLHNNNYIIPQWQKDMATWTFKKSVWKACAWEQYLKGV